MGCKVVIKAALVDEVEPLRVAKTARPEVVLMVPVNQIIVAMVIQGLESNARYLYYKQNKINE